LIPEEVKGMRRILISLLSVLAVVALVVAPASFSGGGTRSTATPPSVAVYPTEVLSRASSMTQLMSTPGPITGHEYHLMASDEQLRLSESDPEFVRELASYQHQIDRVLGRNP